MLPFRLLRVALHLFVGIWTCAFVFPLTNDHGRHWRIQHWSRKLMRMCGIDVVVHNPLQLDVRRAGLLVSNHVSWLDIFVINTLQPHRFVAKADIRSWPVIGYLVAKAGTIFIARGKMRDVRRIFEDLVHSLGRGEHIAFFPEGTTSAQGTLLPFHPNLFESAIDAKVPVCPVALRYVDQHGALHSAADFIGEMTFAQSMVTILKSGGMKAELIVLADVVTEGAHRRELAQVTRVQIASALGLSIQNSHSTQEA